jgi:integrase
MVPLHPECLAFFDYAKKFEPGEFIFGAFPYGDTNGRSNWMFQNFNRFRVKACKIVDPMRRLNLYSLRHTVKTQLTNAKVPAEAIEKIMGHEGGIPGGYGGGPEELPMLAEYVARIDYKE